MKALASIRKCRLEEVIDKALIEYFEKHKSELIK